MLYIVCGLIFVLLFIHVIINMIAFRQVGPTCGYYAIERLCSIIEKRRADKRRVEAYILEEIAKNNSYVGEIFSSNHFITVCKDMGLQDAQLIKTSRKLYQLLSNYYVILPIQKTNPHFILLIRKVTNKYILCWEGSNGYRLMRLDSLMLQHQNLRPFFNWEKYKGRLNRHKDGSYKRRFVMRLRGKNFSRAIADAHNKILKQKMGLQPITLNNICIVVPKNKGKRRK